MSAEIVSEAAWNQVFARLSAELWNASDVAAGLEEALGSSLTSVANLPPATIRALQDVDILRQTLEGLSKFCLRLSESSELHGNPDLNSAVESITMSDLVQRLSGALGDDNFADVAEFFADVPDHSPGMSGLKGI